MFGSLLSSNNSHLVFLFAPRKFCVRIVFIFSWDYCNTQEKLKQRLRKILRGKQGLLRVSYGLRSVPQGSLAVSIKHGLRTTDCRLGIKYGLRW